MRLSMLAAATLLIGTSWVSADVTSPFTLSNVLEPIIQPADAIRKNRSYSTTEPAPAETVAPASGPSEVMTLGGMPHIPSYKMPPVQVKANNPENLFDSQPIGSYGQPRWTANRRFTGTRIYVLPEGEIEAEYWLRVSFNRDDTEYRNLFELEIGLPYRFQLDLYFRTDQADDGDVMIGQQIELRYALANWNVIPLNPTLYFEWANLENEPDTLEGKLLLGGDLPNPRWHYGINLSAEWQLSGDLEHEWRVTGGLSYTVIDSRLYVGVEGIATWVDADGDRGNFSQNYLIGPSIQFKPLPAFTANVVPLIAVGPDDPRGQLFINLQYEF